MKYLGSHKGHINDGYVGSGLRFRAAVSKYGITNFDRIIVDFCYSETEIKQKEQFYLDLYNCSKSDQFYNIAQTAGGGKLGQDYAKISKRMKLHNPNKGGLSRKKYNQMNVAPNIGWKMSEFQRNEISERMTKNNPNKDGVYRKIETWLVNKTTNEILKYKCLKDAEDDQNANHQSVWLHRKNRTKAYRGYYWYVGDEIAQIKID